MTRPLRAHLLLALASPLLLSACGGGGGEPAAGDSATADDTSGGAEAAPAEGHAATAAENMQSHFADVKQARDAVIAGDLATYRRALLRIADAEYGADFPLDWATWAAEMQAVAREKAEAASVGEAAVAIAGLGSTCADCHRATDGGPDVPEGEAPEPGEDVGPIPAQMKRHAWATDQLWLGLTAPSHTAWVRGARTIADPGDTRGTPLGASLMSLQEFAARASLANRNRREEMYAEILARCASCHADHDLGG